MQPPHPTASSALLISHIVEELQKFSDSISNSELRDSILSLITIQDSFRKLGVSIVVSHGYSATSAKGRISKYLQYLAGHVVEGEELAVVSGISEYARRVRELRKEGWPILSGSDLNPKDGQPLRPDQYLLEFSLSSDDKPTGDRGPRG